MPDDSLPRAPRLQEYEVEENRHSVSGLSSGAFMTVQLHLAYSSCFVGAGIIAGGPYRCAESFRDAAILAEDACMLNALYIAMSPLTPMVTPKPDHLAKQAQETASAKQIDPLENIKTHRLYIFSGTKDKVLSPLVVKGTYEFYKALGVPDRNIKFVDDVAAGHSIITSNPEDLQLDANQPPYLNYGGYMQSHHLLQQIYPDLNEPVERLTGKLLRFDQTEFVDGDFDRASMLPFGYVYVPGGVLFEGRKARAVHIALHGCKQGYGYVNYLFGKADIANQPPYGNRYVTTTGYNMIAESNDIIVLYPQATGDDSSAQNPDGCWDWWGYTDASSDRPDYYSREAVQIKAIYRMLQRLCGSGPGNSVSTKRTRAAAASPAEVTR